VFFNRQCSNLIEILATAAMVVAIFHQDLKPENILLTRSGFPKLSDFGITQLGDVSYGTAGPRA